MNIGALPFNAFLADTNPVTHLASQTGPQWILDFEKCQAGSAKRVARDNSPQKGGEIVHRHFKAGLVMQIGAFAATVVEAESGNVTFEPACAEDLVDLFDLLMRHLNAIENADGRLTWLPSGKTPRMMDAARWLGPEGMGGSAFTSVLTEREQGVFTGAQFALLCPFPYAMDAPQTTTPLGGSTPVLVDNDGTSEFFPVIKVFGPASMFEIECTPAVTGITSRLIYSDAFPDAPTIPAGHFLELDFFRETAYIDGSGANAKAGIDVLNSDFWSLAAGDNVVEIFGASADMLWQPAWAS